jgi:hypothetical protein
MGGEPDGLFLDGDPLCEATELMAGAPPRPAKGYVTCPLAWLSRVRSHVRSVDQLIVLQLLYRQCLLSRSRTVALTNGELEAFGISRQTKYRLLAWLQSAGIGAIENQNGRALRCRPHSARAHAGSFPALRHVANDEPAASHGRTIPASLSTAAIPRSVTVPQSYIAALGKCSEPAPVGW